MQDYEPNSFHHICTLKLRIKAQIYYEEYEIGRTRKTDLY